MSDTHKLTLLPEGKIVEVEEGKSLLLALQEKDIYIKSSCGGFASCSDCIIKIRSGEDHISSPSIEEINLLGNVFHITKERLACQTKIEGPVSIDISGHDKDADKEKLRQKTSGFSKKRSPARVRKPAERDKIIQERRDAAIEKNKVDDTWEKHWEKEKDTGKIKKLGGNKRPVPFKYENEEDSED